MMTINPSPFKSWRPYQEQTVLTARKALEDGKNVIISAPVGFGKSLVNVKIAEGYSAYYIVSTKNLQDQMGESFKDIPILKGRDNYPCRADPTMTCGECLLAVDICPVDKTELHCNNCDRPKCPCDECYYEEAKKKAIESKITVVNTALLMTASFLEDRDLLIIDEAHLLEQSILSSIKVTFREDSIWYPHSDSDSEKQSSTPKFEEYILPLREVKDKILDREKILQQEFREAEKVDDKITISKERDKVERLRKKVSFLLDDYRKNKEPWAVIREKMEDKRMHKYIKTVSFAPISASRFLGKVLDKGKQFVLSSATPPNTEDLRSYLEENRKKITTIEVPSTFPREHRPILMDYAGKMGMKYRDKTIPKMAKKIEVLSADRPTIVHCHSYKIATAIAENISPGKDYILQSDREQDLERFRREGGIFLSVNMNDGVSLDGDICRINILAKIPFPNLKDAQVEARRKYEGDGWMNRQVARQITQAYGRTTRSKDDWSRFYILDSDFSWFYQRNKGYFPKWFREAIRIKVKPQTA